MNTFGTDVVEEEIDDKVQEVASDEPKINIPLRQRRLPASFWQEPCTAKSPEPNREITYPATAQPSLHQQFPATSMHPWAAMNSNNAAMPLFLPQRIVPQGHFLLPQNTGNPQWIRSSSNNCCTCAACVNYPYAIPRLPDLYNGLRYRPALNVPCCPLLNCTDQNCKMCSATDGWHPDRLRHLRLRAARYNAILD